MDHGNDSSSDVLSRILSSERINKDVEMLMNSSYWIEALKNKSAVGISEQLNYQLIESQQFIKDFVRYSVHTKRTYLTAKINSYHQEGMSKLIQCIEPNQYMEQLVNNVETTECQNNLNKDVNNNDLPNSQQTDRFVSLPIQFLLECIFLAILDSKDYISTSNDITNKTVEWFPEMRSSSRQIKSIIEFTLNTTACFKRLINLNKTSQNNRPIILGRRQYLWSVNHNFLKPFVRYFYKLKDSKNTEKPTVGDESTPKFSFPLPKLPTATKYSQELPKSSPYLNSRFSSVDRANLFHWWKSKIEQFKLLIQMKHNSYGLTWCEESMSAIQKNTDSLHKIDFIRLGKPVRLKSMRTFAAQTEAKKPPASQHKPTSKKRVASAPKPVASTNHTEVNRAVNQLQTDQDNKKPAEATVEASSLNVESMLNNEEITRLEQSKNISSMISENFTLSIVGSSHHTTNTIQTCNYFSSLPISPGTMCHSYAATSFFNPNEMNVSNMLTVSNVETCVEELFCDDL